MTQEKSPFRFILKLSEALHKNGAAADRLENAVTSIASHFQVDIQVFSTPTAVFGGYEDDQGPRAQLIRVQPGQINLGKLCDLDEVGNDVISGKLSLSQGLQRIQEIDSQPGPYPNLLIALCFGLVSGTISVFLNVGLPTVFSAMVVGLIVGLVFTFLCLFSRLNELAEVFLGLVAALFALTISSYFPEVVVPSLILSSLIAVIPGIGFTIAIVELSTNNLASGTARLMGALMSILKLIFGVMIGTKIFELLDRTSPQSTPQEIPYAWLEWVAVVVAGLSLTVIFRARPTHCGWMILAAAISLTTAKVCGFYFGPELGVMFGGLIVGAASNLFARLINRPSSVFRLPGIVLLVPGILGYESFYLLSQKQVLSGLESAFSMLFIAISLVVGLLLGNVLVPARKSL